MSHFEGLGATFCCWLDPTTERHFHTDKRQAGGLRVTREVEGEPEAALAGSDTREEESNDAPSIVLLNRRVHVSPVAASTETV